MRIGLIGCGKQGAKHAAGLKKCAGVELVMADRDTNLARSLSAQFGGTFTGSPDRLFADPDISGVVISVPTPFHAGLIDSAISSGKHFFCEKPLCDSAVEARDLSARTMQGGRIGTVGYVYRHVGVFQKIRTLLGDARETGTSEVLGRLSVVLMRIGGRGSAAPWKHRAAEGGGAINEMLTHMVDLAVWWCGPIGSTELVISELLRPVRIIAGKEEPADAEDFVVVRLRTRSGVLIVIEADLVTPAFTQSVEVQGDNGSIMGSIQSDMPQYMFLTRPVGNYPAGRMNFPIDTTNLFDAQMADFVAAIRDARVNEDTTLRDSVFVMETLDQLRRASAPAPE